MRSRNTSAHEGLESRQADAVIGDAVLLDVKGVAAMLGCSTRHVYRMSDAGRMPRPLKIGQLVRWRRTEVLDWIAGGCPAVRSARGATP